MKTRLPISSRPPSCVSSSQGAVPPIISRRSPTWIPEPPDTRHRPNSRGPYPTSRQPLRAKRARAVAKAIRALPNGSPSVRRSAFPIGMAPTGSEGAGASVPLDSGCTTASPGPLVVGAVVPQGAHRDAHGVREQVVQPGDAVEQRQDAHAEDQTAQREEVVRGKPPRPRPRRRWPQVGERPAVVEHEVADDRALGGHDRRRHGRHVEPLDQGQQHGVVDQHARAAHQAEPEEPARVSAQPGRQRALEEQARLRDQAPFTCAASEPRQPIRPSCLSTRSRITATQPSTKIRHVILERPATRSGNRIGTSTRRRPARWQRWFISTWNAYPFERTAPRSTPSSASRRKHLNPPVQSRTGRPSISRAYALPPA